MVGQDGTLSAVSVGLEEDTSSVVQGLLTIPESRIPFTIGGGWTVAHGIGRWSWPGQALLGVLSAREADGQETLPAVAEATSVAQGRVFEGG